MLGLRRRVTPSTPSGVTTDGHDYRVQSRWKEEVVYSEGGLGYLFDAGWGVKPHVLYVPSAAIWDDSVPEWMKGRRDAVVAALAASSGHRITDTDTGYGPTAVRGRSRSAA